MVLGVIIGILAQVTGLSHIVIDWIKPFGKIFINLLKMIAIPLIIASLVKGVSDLQDISRFSKMGGRTILIYIFTTVVAVSIGLAMVNIIQPGNSIPTEVRESLMSSQMETVAAKQESAAKEGERGPLRALVDVVPENLMSAMANNGNMLQVIFFAIFFGIGMILIPAKKAKPVKEFFDGLNEVILKMIDLIMLGAPYGVFALLAALVAENDDLEVYKALGLYGLTVVSGLGIMIFIFYPLLVTLIAKGKYLDFLRGIAPAQLLAFSTSSSAATLPVTMECVEENLKVRSEVASFVLPVGATINMDGTSLYQAVGAVFIAQVLGYDLTLGQQLSIVVTATLASIGAAAVPGAGILMLIIVLESIGVPSEGIGLILALDRPLDMCRTSVNVTGDAAVSLMVNKAVAGDEIPAKPVENL